MDQVTSQREALQAAHRAWRRATAAHEAKMAGAAEGRPIGWHEAVREVEELARLHRDFMEKSKPFLRLTSDTP